jgi:PEP-CTERM motif
MTHRIFFKSAIGALLAFVSFVAPVGADPLVVTSGKFSLSFGDPTTLILEGDTFRLVTIHPIGQINLLSTCNFVCDGGTELDLAATVSGFAEDHISQTLNGAIHTGSIFVASDLHFDAPMVMLPASVDEDFLFSAPFTMVGHVAASSDGRFANGAVELTAPTLFQAELVGRGTVSARLINGSAVGASPRQFALVGLQYRFEEAAPTPEPATTLLLAVGLTVAWRRSRRTGGQPRS